MQNFYTGRMRAGAPSGSPAQYSSADQIDNVLKSSDPTAVTVEGQSYRKFASAYEKIAGELLSMRDDLDEAWGGENAAAAQSQLREVWSAASTIHKTADAFGSAIESHGSEYLAWYKNSKPKSTSLADARNWMTGANERVSQSWSSLPPDLSTTLPRGYEDQGYDPASSGSPSGPGSSSGGVSGGVRPGAGRVPETIGQVPDDHSGASGSGSELAGFTPPDGGAANGLGGPPGGGLGSGTPSPFSSGGGYVGGSGAVAPGTIGGFGPGSVRGLGSPPGSRLPGGMDAAASEAEAEAAAAESGAGARPGGVMGPMAGGRGAEERERARRSWLAEDEDVWTGDIGSSPEVIGAIEPSADEEAPPKPAIEIDLAGDDDELAAILAELGGHQEIEPSGDSPEGDPPEDVSAKITELREQLARLEHQRDAQHGFPNVAEDTGSERDWLNGEGL